MEIIVFEKESYYKMLAEMKRAVKDAVKESKSESKQVSDTDQWVEGKEAETILKCKRDKLKQLRDDEKIRVSHHGRKILYYKPSLYEFLENNAIGTSKK